MKTMMMNAVICMAMFLATWAAIGVEWAFAWAYLVLAVVLGYMVLVAARSSKRRNQ